MKFHKILTVIPVLLLLGAGFMLTSCGPAVLMADNAGTVNLETLDFAEYTEIEPVLEGTYLSVTTAETLASSSSSSPRVSPCEAVWFQDELWFLGKTGLNMGLYRLPSREDGAETIDGLLIAEKVAEPPEGAQWSGLQSAGDLLMWEQEAENLPQERLAYSPEEGMVRPPFQGGQVMHWGGSYYVFSGPEINAALERETPDGKYDTVVKLVFRPYEETCLQDGVFAYLHGHEERIIRIDLEASAAKDDVAVKNGRPDGVQCNEDWLVGVTDEGQIFAYSYAAGEGHFVTQIAVDASGVDGADARVWLRSGQLWVLEEYQLAVYDLMDRTVQHITLPGSKYSRWNLDAAGRLAGCDLLDGYIITMIEG